MCQTWSRIRIQIGIKWKSDPDPDQYQNNADPRHYFKGVTFYLAVSKKLWKTTWFAKLLNNEVYSILY